MAKTSRRPRKPEHSDDQAKTPGDGPIFLTGGLSPAPYAPSAATERAVGIAAAAIATLLLGGVAVGFGYKTYQDRQATLPVAALENPGENRDIEKLSAAVPAAVSAVPDHLMQRTLEVPQMFSGFATPADKLCEALSTAGVAMEGWQRSEMSLGTWECSATIGFGSDEDDQPRSSIFVSVRGSETGPVASFRMKINLLDESQDKAMIVEASRVLSILQSFPDLSLPRNINYALENLTPLRMATYTAEFRFAPEPNDDKRYNLVVSYKNRRS